VTAADLQARLRAGLPANVPVLPPRDYLLPAEWQEEGADGDLVENGGRGLHAYLRQQAPQGYVQLQHGDGLSSNGVLDVGMVQISVTASTHEDAQALAQHVRRLIGSQPVRPTLQAFQSAQTFEQDDHTRIVLTFETRAIGV